MARDPQAVRKQLADAIQFVRSRIYTIENEFARNLLRQYQQAYEEQARILDELWRRHVGADAWTVSDRRWQARTADLIDQIAAQMDDLNKRVHDELVDEQVRAWRASYAGNGWIVDRFSAPDYAAQVPVVPVEAVRAQLLYPYEGNTQWFRLEANRTDFITKLRQSMVQSQIQGETISQAQKRLANVLGLPIGRRNLSDRQANGGNFHRTEMIARTELLRSSNLGSQAVYQANSDVVKEQEITATLDARTCPICGPKDGKRVPLDSTDVPPYHPNCRCTTTPVTLTLAEMGIDAPEMGPGTRASMFGPVSGDMKYAEWARTVGLNPNDDGGLANIPPGKPPKSPGAAPARARPRR